MTDYEKLKKIYDEIDVLISNNVTSRSPEFIAWKNKATRFLINKFGEKSYEFKEFQKYYFTLTISFFNTSNNDYVQKCRDDLLSVKAVFKTYLEELEDEIPETNNTSSSEITQKIQNAYSKIFIVHGHDGELKEGLARMVEKQDLDAIILNEQVNRGKTIIEKIEKYSDVKAAICLFTADDLGKADDETDYNKRARQNVVFEAGYFIGKLGRENVVIVADEDLEIPSDLSGVVYTSSKNWETDVFRELKDIGYSIDFNKLYD